MSEKITKEQVLSEIADVDYVVVPGTTTTIATVLTKSGPVFVGTSACISKDDFDAEKGKEIALNEAVGKLWGALGTAKAFTLAGCPIISGGAY